jgi:hypothetical protein
MGQSGMMGGDHPLSLQPGMLAADHHLSMLGGQAGMLGGQAGMLGGQVGMLGGDTLSQQQQIMLQHSQGMILDSLLQDSYAKYYLSISSNFIDLLYTVRYRTY